MAVLTGQRQLLQEVREVVGSFDIVALAVRCNEPELLIPAGCPIDARIVDGDPHIVIGVLIGEQGIKILLDIDGDVAGELGKRRWNEEEEKKCSVKENSCRSHGKNPLS